ncbi:PqqD family protein [Desulfobulbus alkaliphilus]|uniref:PqqD family protein n=1 Tax=Desulfobulbus alkaliphilus TaxID=869814 RepID=UPI0019646626|nr:PqqD family protein [Desulfobulbus alkaliphilus]MBM9537999.1 PqqD family protein [Desulfobulbus alkaliphilus]
MQHTIRRKPDFILERIDDEIVVYHPTLTTSMYCNPTGALVWELCDGSLTTGEIVDLLAEIYPEDSEQIRASVPAVIDQLLARGMVELT